MKKILAILILLLGSSLQAASNCVDNGDSTSDCTVTVSNSNLAVAQAILDAMELGAHLGWSDLGGGDPWGLVLLATTTTDSTGTATQKKDSLEQIRASHNYFYRCGGAGAVCSGDDTLSAPAWVGGMMTGIENTQAGVGQIVMDFGGRLWAQFLEKWLSPTALAACRVPPGYCLTEGLSVAVPPAPSP